MSARTWNVVFNLFLRSSAVQKKRAALTIAAIAWGSLSLLILLSFGTGLSDSLSAKRAAMGTNIAILWPSVTTKDWRGIPAGRQVNVRIDDVAQLAAQVQGHTGLAAEVSRWGVPLSWGAKSINGHITGVDPQFGEMRNQIAESGGRFIDDSDQSEKRRVIFLGDQVATELFGRTDVVGEVIKVSGVPFTVVGVLKHRLQMGNYSGPDDRRAVIPIGAYRALFGSAYVDNLVLRTAEPQQMASVLKSFREVAARRYGFDPADDRVFATWDTVESSKVFSNVLIGIQAFLGIIGALTLIVGGVGVANIMFAVVKERTREIGVQMALGARPSWITGPIVLEALTYTFLGGLLGLLLAIILIGLLSLIPTQGNDALEFLGKPTLSISTGLFSSAILGLIGLLAGYIPARRAARIDPARTLRYE